ncbi:hypothetical protein P378_20710 [Desulforamulus profundi]|uniref:Uncharacterized protein n=1 Tax=Desulforamulus profundi TaxID=1383067 RepID=A0A2C6MBY3_9FIRM|nr:IS66 family insertion sequence element accessory protein TnpB [Desulforamulus profundi]PHJ36706.1 hypothetical protein P378_20710 [Desulforamulus profundi]
MLTDAGVDRVYLACGATDLRKSIDGLAALVKEGLAWIPLHPVCLFFATGNEINSKYFAGITTGSGYITGAWSAGNFSGRHKKMPSL